MPDGIIDAAALAFRFALGFVFLTAAVPKLSRRSAFRSAVANYGLLPGRAVGAAAALLPPLELLCATLLLVGLALRVVAGVAALLLFVFVVAVAANLVRGRRIDCGCSGSIVPRSIGWSLVAGDLVLAGMALAVGVVDPPELASLPPAHADAALGQANALAVVLVAGAGVVGWSLASSWLRLRTVMHRGASS